MLNTKEQVMGLRVCYPEMAEADAERETALHEWAAAQKVMSKLWTCIASGDMSVFAPF